MADNDQITRHEREIGELRGKLDGLATKDFVRQVVQEQTQEIYRKLDAMSAENNERFAAMSAENNERFAAMSAESDKKFEAIAAELKALNDKQHRITGAAEFLRSALPLVISIVTLIVLIISLLAGNG